jgi:hypothetical protein
MRRKRHLIAEFLEQRALLSSLAYSLTTNQPAYQAGQPILMTFTETNTGSQPVTVQVDPTDFTVSQDGQALWQSNPASALAPATKTLQPGQSTSQSATWDGTTLFTLPGLNGATSWHLNHFGTFSISNPNAPQGLSASFQITNPLTTSLTTDKQVYQLGDTVQATFTEVNTAPVSITIPSSPPESFLVYQNGTPLWMVAYPQIIRADPTVLSAGQTVTDSQSLKIIPATGPYRLDRLTGTFDVTFGPQNDPTQYTTPIQVIASSPADLVTSISTDQPTYTAGQPVHLSFSETNVGTQPIVVLTGPNGFQITQNGTVVWNSPDSGTGSAQQKTWATLQPGQTYSQIDTWDGVSMTGSSTSLAAPYIVTNIFDPNADTASFQFAVPGSGQLSTSLTTDKSIYQLGQPVTLNFTETNIGTAPIQVVEGPSDFVITQNGQVVWKTAPLPLMPGGTIADRLVTLQPGQSYTQTATWNGVPDKLPSAYPSGTFVVSNSLEPPGKATTFQIVAQPAADLTTKITTDKSVYDSGEPVQITLSETNVSAQPIVVLTGPPAFQISHAGTVFWQSANPITLPALASWQTLQPGQSYTQTLTWKASLNSAVVSSQVVGQFSVSDLLDPDGSSASFQVLPTVYVPPPPTMPPVPVPPVPVPPVPVPPVPVVPPSPPSPSPVPVTGTLIPSRSVYQSGQAVRLALILKNISKSKVAVASTTGTDGITVMQGSSVVFHSGQIAGFAGSIRPRGTLKLALTWSGRSNQTGISNLAPGTYTISVVKGGYTATTSIRIVGRK